MLKEIKFFYLWWSIMPWELPNALENRRKKLLWNSLCEYKPICEFQWRLSGGLRTSLQGSQDWALQSLHDWFEFTPDRSSKLHKKEVKTSNSISEIGGILSCLLNTGDTWSIFAIPLLGLFEKVRYTKIALPDNVEYILNQGNLGQK